MKKKGSSKKKRTNSMLAIRLTSPVIILSSLLFLLIIIWGSLNVLSKNNQLSSKPFIKSQVSGVKNTTPNPSKTPTQPGQSKSTEARLAQPVGYQLQVPILYYHYIGNNPNPLDTKRDSLSTVPDKFREQIKYLKDNGYTAISLDTLYAALKKQTTLPQKPVVLTFDDGYIDFYFNAFPILQEFNMHATVFVPVGLVGQSSYLNWDQIKFMHNSGLISFQSHGINHVNMNSLPKFELDLEMRESKKILQDKLGTPVNFISYPYGVSSEEILTAAREAGYVGGVGTWLSKTQSEGTIYNMPRIRIGGGITITTFSNNL